MAVDYRGHGQSQYDRNPDNYTLPVALTDLSAGAGHIRWHLLRRHPRHDAGGPAADGHRGVILNDIGPVIEPHGLVRLKGYIGKLPIPRNFEEATSAAPAVSR